MIFSEEILKWYRENKRQLPWRDTRDPYKVWISEIILQQTRVAQGMPYYQRFVAQYPTVSDMARAREEEVLKLWQGLGYYSRARNMHATAKTVVSKLNGKFPETYEGLLKLKGIGDYTASAIASFCFDELQPVVDGNVYRVLSRYFGIDLAINSTAGIKQFKQLAKKVMSTTNIRDYNQGIMEFGAIQCAPRKPYCLHCPLNKSCVALATNRIAELPVKLKKSKVKLKHFNYLVVVDANGQTILEQRKGKGIWQNLYQFPLLETKEEMAAISLGQLKDLGLGDHPSILLYNERPMVHKLSHQHLYTKFWIVRTDKVVAKAIPWEKLPDFPVPVLIADFIKRFKF